jgi:hypothetical protein
MQKLPQLTLRDLFWLVALVAMGVGWCVDRTQLASSSSESLRTLAKGFLELTNAWQEQERTLEAERNLWKYRAEAVAKRVQEDGYHVTWSGNWNDHTFDVEPPSKLP